ncbi:MAG: antitoxin [Candidatus Delongbacteria bacterium]|nr:antitoxin [Candidatus Delongbacteria bacterium]
MANLQVKDINDKLYDALKYYAKKEHRSVSQEVVKIIELYLQNNKGFENTTKEFLKLAGSWDDERTADEIINDLTKSRTNKRFNDGIFD